MTDNINTAGRIKCFRRSVLGLAAGSLAGCLGDGTNTQGGPEASPGSSGGGSPRPLPEEDATIVVTTDGNANGTGTVDDPVDSIQTARDMAREKVDAVDGDTLAIALREGTHRLESPVKLTEQDSGTEDTTIEYRSYPGEEATISGGVSLSIEEDAVAIPSEAKNRLQQGVRDEVVAFDLEAAGIESMPEIKPRGKREGTPFPSQMVFLGDQPLELARYPNEGFVKTASGGVSGQPWSWGYEGSFKYYDERPEEWESIDDVWVWGMWAYTWAPWSMQLESIDPEKNQLTTDLKTRSTPEALNSYGVGKDQPFYYFNVLEELDIPGEYYIDHDELMLYLYPPEDGLDEVTVAVRDEALIKGTNVSNVRFRDLEIQAGQWHGASIKGDSNTFEACRINKLGAWGLRLDGSNNVVTGCDMADMGTGGIRLDGGEMRTLTNGASQVHNCDIQTPSLIKRGAYAIELHGVGQVASNNHLHNIPHHALTWEGPLHRIEYNHIHDVIEDVTDAGAIYAWGEWHNRGVELRNNFIHDVNSGGEKKEVGIYLDDGTSGITCFGNVLINCDMGMMIGGGRSNTIQNNLVLYCNHSVQIDQRNAPGEWRHPNCENGRVLKPKFREAPTDAPAWKERFPDLQGLLDDEPCLPKYNVFTRNVIYQSPNLRIENLVREYGTIEDNLETTDRLGFRSAEAMTFEFSSDSMVTKQYPEWEPIDITKIGLRKDPALSTREDVPPITDRVNPFSGVDLSMPEGLYVDQTAEIGVTAFAFDGSELEPDTIRYSLDDPGVANISEDGVVTGNQVASTIVAVSVTIDGKTITRRGKLQVTIESEPIAGFEQYSSTVASFSQDGDNKTINANGADIWTGADEYGVLYKPDALGPTGTVELKIESVGKVGNKNTKTGIMVRNDITGAGSSTGYILVNVAYQSGWVVQSIFDADGDGAISEWSSADTKYESGPFWLKLEKEGTTFHGYHRKAETDDWTKFTGEGIELGTANAVQDVGAFYSAHDDAKRGTMTFSTFDVQSEYVPTDLGATRTSEGAVDLSWTYAEDDASGYNVYRSRTAGGGDNGYTKLTDSAVSATSYSDTSAAANTMYYYVVAAVTPDGETSFSTETGIDTNPEPTAMTAKQTDASTVELNWKAPSYGVDHYQLQKSTDGGESWSTIANDVTATSATDTSFGAVPTSYGVRAVASDGSKSSRTKAFVGAEQTLGEYKTYSTHPADFTVENGTITIRGGGSGGHYVPSTHAAVYRKGAFEDGGSVTVNMESLENTDWWTRGGLIIGNDIPIDQTGMIKGIHQTPGPDWQETDDYVLAWDKNGDGTLAANFDAGEYTSTGGKNTSFPSWLKIEREGTTFRFFYREDPDADWTQVNNGVTIEEAAEQQDVGVYAISGNERKAKAVFSGLEIQ